MTVSWLSPGEGQVKSQGSAPQFSWASILPSGPSHSFRVCLRPVSWHVMTSSDPSLRALPFRVDLEAGGGSVNDSNKAFLVTWRVGLTQETSRPFSSTSYGIASYNATGALLTFF